MNGTSVMTALACLAFDRARTLARAVAPDGDGQRGDARRAEPLRRAHLRGQAAPRPGAVRAMDPRAPRVPPGRGAHRGPHPGPLLHPLRAARHRRAGRRAAVASARSSRSSSTAPTTTRSSTPRRGDVLHGGNFYGGHVAFAMDGAQDRGGQRRRPARPAARAAVQPRAPATGCRRTWSPLTARRQRPHHGFKAMQIAASALTAEALKLTMPASVFSRSTECHNQDKVSMGTIAARDALRVLELTERRGGHRPARLLPGASTCAVPRRCIPGAGRRWRPSAAWCR